MVRLALALWLAGTALAFAQSNPGFSDNVPLFASPLNAAFTSKADALNGVLTTPIINNPTINGGTLTGAFGGNPTFTGTLSLNAVQSFTVTGLETISAGGGWSSFNIGKQLLITTSPGSSSPGIGITDQSGGNAWAIYNAAGGVITIASMPPIANSALPPAIVSQFSTTGLSVTGTSAATRGFVANGSVGVSCGPGAPSSSFQVVLGIVVQC